VICLATVFSTQCTSTRLDEEGKWTGCWLPNFKATFVPKLLTSDSACSSYGQNVMRNQSCEPVQKILPYSCSTRVLWLCQVSGRSEQSAADDSSSCSSWTSLWSQLHLFIIQTLTAFSSLPGSQQLELITLVDVNQTVKDLLALAHASPHQTSLAIDRFVQILQVALATGAFRCSLGKN